MPTPQSSLKSLILTTPVVTGQVLSIDSTVLPYVILTDLATSQIELSLYSLTYINQNAVPFLTRAAVADIQLSGTAPSQVLTVGYTLPPNASIPQIGTVVTLTNTGETFFNNQTYVVTSSNSTQFTAVYTAGAAGAFAINNAEQATAIWTNQNQFSGTLAIDPTQAETFLQIIGRNYDPTLTWIANIPYVAGQRLLDSHGNVQIVVQAGVSGGTSPSWNTVLNGLTSDAGVSWKNLGVIAVTPIFKFSLIYFATSDALVIAPPSAVKAYKGLSSCKIEWQLPTYPGFIGTRLMIGTDPTGVTTPFSQYGDLVNNVTRSSNVVVSEQTSTQVNEGTTVITTTQQTQPINYSSVDVPASFFSNQTNQPFYAMVSTVIQDPNTQTIYESQQNGPITCGFVNLRLVNPTDFLALQRKEDIAGRWISGVTSLYPSLDLTPRSELRDIVIDPVALELSNMSTREWFSRCAVSISAISQLDDANGDGISDSFSASPFKQRIAQAYGLSIQDTQNLISKQFDILGEFAGLVRAGAINAVGQVTFYTFTRPTSSTTFSLGISCATVPDAETPSLLFQTRGSATVTSQTANSFYDPVNGWWGVTVPVECSSSGSLGNVGAGTVRTIASGGPQGWNVVNQVAMGFGVDNESNAAFANRIADSLVMGVDSGTRFGYKKAAQETPGVVNSLVVAAGDLEMLRDWDPVRQKHVFGCVDIYVQGTSTSEQTEQVLFAYDNLGEFSLNSTYIPLTLISAPLRKFQIAGFSNFPALPYTAVALSVSRSGNLFYLGIERAQFDNVNGNLVLDPTELTYQINGSGVTQVRVPFIINGIPATNLAALTALASAQAGTYTFGLFARTASPLSHIPLLQPILTVNSVTGGGPTGVVDPADIQLVHTQNFYLNGLSQSAADTVRINSDISTVTSKLVTASTVSPVWIDSALDVFIDSNGIPQDVLSVRSSDLSQLYVFGIDYAIVPFGAYHQYALNVLTQSANVTGISITANVISVTAPNNLTPGTQVTFVGIQNAMFLNGQTVTVATASSTGFSATFNYSGTYALTQDSGAANYTRIANGQSVVVSYNKFVLSEQLSFVSQEQQTLNGSLPATLFQEGFVSNTWLPESYTLASDQTTSGTRLTLDGAVFNADGSLNLTASIAAGSVFSGPTFLGYSTLIAAQVPHDSRYIKVTVNDGVGDIVKREGIDYTLVVDPTSGAASLVRILTGTIPDGGVVKVSYFTTETFQVSTEYPSFVQSLTSSLAKTKAAGGSVLVKAMVANQVDVTATVELNATADPATVDPNLRTAIDIAMNKAVGMLSQSNLVSAMQAVTGVKNLQLPLLKCAKTNGAYDIGIVVPTDSLWLPLVQDPEFVGRQVPLNAFITAGAVLPDNTIPSGGQVDAAVGLLYQGQEYRRALSIQDFLENSASAPSFYIIGLNDQIDANTPIPTYALRILLTEPAVPNPGDRAYFVTYQVYNEGGAKNIVMSSTEYLVPGRITLNYTVSGN